MPSLKNIFTAKGYEVGSDYKREVGADDNRCLIQYRVVADGVPTYLVIGDGYFKEIHTEELGSVVHRIEDNMYTELEVLSPEQVEALQDRISDLVNYDTYALGLAGYDPKNIDDRLIIYLTSWRDSNHPNNAQDEENEEEKRERLEITNQAVSEEFEKIKDLETRDIIRLTAQLAWWRHLALRNDDNPEIVAHIESVVEWMMEKNSRHQITTMDKVINRFNQIQNLLQDYQLSAANMGLSIEQAEIITSYQYDYIATIYDNFYESGGVEIPPATLQAKFEEVRDLREEHQINSFCLGFTAEQAQTISPDQTRYLMQNHNQETGAQGVHENYARIRNLPQIHQINGLNLGLSEEQALRIHPYDSDYLSQTVGLSHTPLSPERVQQIFQQIESLQPYQKIAFRYGVDLPDAANLSEENFKEINDISNGRGESNELNSQRKFIEAYTTFQKEQAASQAQAKLNAEIAEAQRQATPLALTNSNSANNLPRPPSPISNPQRPDKRDRENDGDETGSNKKPDRSL